MQLVRLQTVLGERHFVEGNRGRIARASGCPMASHVRVRVAHALKNLWSWKSEEPMNYSEAAGPCNKLLWQR
jgi:hypothetical protein